MNARENVAEIGPVWSLEKVLRRDKNGIVRRSFWTARGVASSGASRPVCGVVGLAFACLASMVGDASAQKTFVVPEVSAAKTEARLFLSGFENVANVTIDTASYLPPDHDVLAADAIPLIGVDFSIGQAPVPPISLWVDGQDVTAMAVLSSSTIRYQPTQALQEGAHKVALHIGEVLAEWSFTTLTAPLIGGEVPKDIAISPENSVFVGAGWSDVGAGVDPSTVRLFLNDADVTSQAEIIDASIHYSAVDPLSVGIQHARLQVADFAGNIAESAWTFRVAELPQITGMFPDGSILETDNGAVIGAAYSSGTSDLDPTRTALFVNDVNVTAASVIEYDDAKHGRIRWARIQPNDVGNYTVLLQVATVDDLIVQRVWSFEVIEPSVYDLMLLTPEAGTTLTTAAVSVELKVNANRSYANRVRINEQDATLLRREDDGVVYATSVMLQPGVNMLRTSATFQDGTERALDFPVTFDAPPQIVELSPSDQHMFGPMQRADGKAAGDARDLTGATQHPINVSGRLSRPIDQVLINQQLATLSSDRTQFEFPQFFLHEGSNFIGIAATDELGRTTTRHAVWHVDYTAPLLTVVSPADGLATSEQSIAVHGIAHDAVEPALGAGEPTVSVRNLSNDTETTVVASNRHFLLPRIALEMGENRLRVTAKDGSGNQREQQLVVVRTQAGSSRIALLSGDQQTGQVMSEVSQPLQIVAIDASGLPIADASVRFDLLRGSGSIRRYSGVDELFDGVQSARNLTVSTDASGRAEAWLVLGREAGPAAHSVSVRMDGQSSGLILTATALPRETAAVLINGQSGSQFVQTQSTPLEALSALAIDEFRNPMVNVELAYQVISGDLRFDAQSAAGGVLSDEGRRLIVRTDKNGVSSARPHAGSIPGAALVRVDAVLADASVGSANFQLTIQDRRDGPTSFAGVVLDHTGAPLAGVILSIGRTSLSTLSDASGKFEFVDQVPEGKIDLFVDGTSVQIIGPDQTLNFPALHLESVIVEGQLNQLPHAIYLPPIPLGQGVVVGGNEDVRLTMPGLAGFAMVVKANSVTFPDGSHEGMVVVTPVNADRLPMVPPGGFGSFGVVAWTIQPSGTRFDPPIRVEIPNAYGLARGESLPIVQWDHDLATFVAMGRGTVSEDGTRIVTDPGTGISKAGWGGGPPPVPDNDGCGPAGEPDLAQCIDFANFVERCPSVRKFTPKITIAPTAESPDLVSIGDKEFTALSEFVYGFTATLDRGDVQYIEWSTDIKNSDRLSSFTNVTPANGKGASYSFGTEVVRFTSGSVAESPPIHFELTATLCGKKETILIKQDIPDIIRQEYTDFREDVTGFTLSVPVRSRLALSTLYTPNRGLNNPYLVGHSISLDDPSQIARDLQSAYTNDLRNTSLQRYQQQLSTLTDPAQIAQIQAQINQVQATTYSPIMTSAWRSPRHNKSVNGVTCSNHMKGGAVDLQPSDDLPPNIRRTANEHWCALRRACTAASYDECLLELPRNTGAGWNGDHACTINTTYNAVHAGTRAPCS